MRARRREAPEPPRRGKPRSKITVAAYATSWLEGRSAPPFVSRHSQGMRRSVLRAWIVPAIGEVALADLDLGHLEKLQENLLARGLRLSTVKHTALDGVLRSLWAQARRERVVRGDPWQGLQWPREAPQKPNPFDCGERDRLLDYFRTVRPRYYAFVTWAFGTGMRPGELCGLQSGDLDWGRGTASISRALVGREMRAAKTRGSARTIAVPSDLLELVRGREGWVFVDRHGEPLDSVNWGGHHWGRATQAVGIPHRRFYCTRHTYISLALSAGAAPLHVAQHCGTSLEMLDRHYARYLASATIDPLSLALHRHPDSIRQLAFDFKTAS